MQPNRNQPSLPIAIVGILGIERNICEKRFRQCCRRKRDNGARVTVPRVARRQKDVNAVADARQRLSDKIESEADAPRVCAKCMARSNLWKPEAWPDLGNVPSLAEALIAHAKLSLSRGEMQAIIDESFNNRMY